MTTREFAATVTAPHVRTHERPSVSDVFERPMHDLRLSVMDRCNLRCTYCMPRATYHENYRFLGASERLERAEIVRLAGIFTRLGTRKLRVTGGEPLLFNGISELVRELARLPEVEEVALTSNGLLLAKHAAALKAAGLKRITLSLDSLDPEVFARMSGGGHAHVDDVLQGIEAARREGFAPIKINAVVQRGVNDAGVLDLVEHFRGTGIVLRFIEYMDVGNRNQWQRGLVVPSAELVARISARWPLLAAARRSPNEVAERYVFADGGGELGFISSVTQPFCGACTRARVSSDGVLYTCLFATQGTNLRELLRQGASDDELAELIRGVWSKRADRYSEQRGSGTLLRIQRPKVEMYHVGG